MTRPMANKPRAVVRANTLKKNIGINVKRLRDANQLSQLVVARSLGVSQPYLSALERGRFSMSAAHFLMLAEYFKVSPRVLYKEPVRTT